MRRPLHTLAAAAGQLVGWLTRPATLATTVELAGATLLAYGAAAVYRPAGYLTGGLLLLLAGGLRADR